MVCVESAAPRLNRDCDPPMKANGSRKSNIPESQTQLPRKTREGEGLRRLGRFRAGLGFVSRLLRNGVGVSSVHTVVFVISEVPMNFHEFASLFRDKLGCPNGLYLDGVVSSLYAPSLKRNDFRMVLGPIIAVTG